MALRRVADKIDSCLRKVVDFRKFKVNLAAVDVCLDQFWLLQAA